MRKGAIFPHHPTRLQGSAWTRIGDEGVTHFEVVEQRKRLLLLRSLSGEESILLPWRALRERTRWRPGWRSYAEVCEASA